MKSSTYLKILIVFCGIFSAALFSITPKEASTILSGGTPEQRAEGEKQLREKFLKVIKSGPSKSIDLSLFKKTINLNRGKYNKEVLRTKIFGPLIDSMVKEENITSLITTTVLLNDMVEVEPDTGYAEPSVSEEKNKSLITDEIFKDILVDLFRKFGTVHQDQKNNLIESIKQKLPEKNKIIDAAVQESAKRIKTNKEILTDFKNRLESKVGAILDHEHGGPDKFIEIFNEEQGGKEIVDEAGNTIDKKQLFFEKLISSLKERDYISNKVAAKKTIEIAVDTFTTIAKQYPEIITNELKLSLAKEVLNIIESFTKNGTLKGNEPLNLIEKTRALAPSNSEFNTVLSQTSEVMKLTEKKDRLEFYKTVDKFHEAVQEKNMEQQKSLLSRFKTNVLEWFKSAFTDTGKLTKKLAYDFTTENLNNFLRKTIQEKNNSIEIDSKAVADLLKELQKTGKTKQSATILETIRQKILTAKDLSEKPTVTDTTFNKILSHLDAKKDATLIEFLQEKHKSSMVEALKAQQNKVIQETKVQVTEAKTRPSKVKFAEEIAGPVEQKSQQPTEKPTSILKKETGEQKQQREEMQQEGLRKEAEQKEREQEEREQEEREQEERVRRRQEEERQRQEETEQKAEEATKAENIERERAERAEGEHGI